MDPTIVHTLLGHKQMEISLRCLSSLHRTSVEDLSFALHEDGTLTPDDILKLRDSLPISSIITKKEADERVIPMLKGYKHCHQYRIEQFVGVKLFDLAMLGGPEIYYCDTDILFLAPHRGLFAKALENADFVFSPDIQNAYSLQPWHIKPFTGIGVHRRTNSGLFGFRKAAYQLEFMDRFFATFKPYSFFQKRQWWTEQTAWSAMATQGRTFSYDPKQLGIADPGFRYDPNETIAIHFVGPQRHTIVDYDHVRREQEPPKDIRTFPSPRANTVTWFVEKSISKVKEKLAKK